MPSSVFMPRNLVLLLGQAREAVLSHFRPLLSEFQLTEQQWRIIRALHSHEPLEPREICDICLFLSPSLAGILARMEELGLIRKERVERDQRRVLIWLTDKSRDILVDIHPRIAKIYEWLEQEMGNEDFSQVYKLLEKIKDLQMVKEGEDKPRQTKPQSKAAAWAASEAGFPEVV